LERNRQSDQIKLEIIPEIVRKNGGKISQADLIAELKKKGASKSAAYRYKDEAFQHRLIKSCKGTDEIMLT